MSVSAPLKIIFVTLTDEDGNNPYIHVGFYDLFGGIAEVLPSSVGGQPELVISPINQYFTRQHEIIELWIKLEEKEKIGQAVRTMFDKNDPLTMIFSGNLVQTDCAALTDISFCVEALRAALPILPSVPVNCITPQKLYTVLKMMGGM